MKSLSPPADGQCLSVFPGSLAGATAWPEAPWEKQGQGRDLEQEQQPGMDPWCQAAGNKGDHCQICCGSPSQFQHLQPGEQDLSWWTFSLYRGVEIAQLVERPAEKPRHNTDIGWSPQCSRIFRPGSSFSADSLWVSVQPHEQLHG